VADIAPPGIDIRSPEAFFSRELSWLNFARRVLSLVEDPAVPLLERAKFAGIVGMLHDEFFMKRISGLKRQMKSKRQSKKLSLDGRTPDQEFAACRDMLVEQEGILSVVVRERLRPALAEAGLAVRDWDDLDEIAHDHLRSWFRTAVYPILTPLAVDSEHPFPFISSGGLNLAVVLSDDGSSGERFVRLKVPGNRPRFVSTPGGDRCPLEQVIAANLDVLFPHTPPLRVHPFRVTRGAEGESARSSDLDDAEVARRPGAIVRQVTDELKARRFAGVVRLEVDDAMPGALRKWLADQLSIAADDVYPTRGLLKMADFGRLADADRPDLRYPAHEPVTHPRLRALDPDDTDAPFAEVRRGDILLHHPYQSFDTSVLRFLENAAADPDVLAIKVTIYRTSSDSPIVKALAEAARRGKQVAVLVEINARFDEAPNIAWGQYLEREGVHVSYGVERLKTHVKLMLVVREEAGGIRTYAHLGTGNYHTGTARIYEDLGLLTCDPEICDDVAKVFIELTGATSTQDYRRLLVAPRFMRDRFVEMIRREADHARHGRPAGIVAKMNQLQDPDLIRELYEAGRAGVPVRAIVRGLNCMRPGVPGLSDNVRVISVVGRFLEHSRIYHFVNGGSPEWYLGSADWMKRNLDRRVETLVPILDESVRLELMTILDTYDRDNASAWDCAPDGSYRRRVPAAGDPPLATQDWLIHRAESRGRRPRAAYRVRG